MNEKQYAAFLGCALIPLVIDLIQQNTNEDTIISISKFYNSKLYQMLEIEDLKIWHYSPLTLYKIYETEIQTGQLIFPEEAA